MPQTIKVSTPDHIEFEYQLAGIGSRFAAVTLDHLFQFFGWLGIAIIYTNFIAAGVVFSERNGPLAISFLSFQNIASQPSDDSSYCLLI